MNIFVTGCAGFIGSSLAQKLIGQGHFLVGIDNFDSYYPESLKQNNINDLEKSSNFKFYFGDIRDKELLTSLFSKYNFDVVVHLAAKAGVRASFEYPQEYVDVNINGTLNILEKMKEYQISKFVFASSSSVYGNSTSDVFSEDEVGLSQISPYAVTKKTGEDLVKIFSNNYGINAVCLRFFTVYGPKQRPDLAIHKFCHAIINNKPLTMFGDGSTFRDYTYIDDITDGIVSAIEYNKTPFEIINLGSARPVSLKDLIQTIEEVLGKKALIEQLPMQRGDVQKTYADIKKAKLLLDYEPKTSFQDGLKRFIEYTF